MIERGKSMKKVASEFMFTPNEYDEFYEILKEFKQEYCKCKHKITPEDCSYSNYMSDGEDLCQIIVKCQDCEREILEYRDWYWIDDFSDFLKQLSCGLAKKFPPPPPKNNRN